MTGWTARLHRNQPPLHECGSLAGIRLHGVLAIPLAVALTALVRLPASARQLTPEDCAECHLQLDDPRLAASATIILILISGLLFKIRQMDRRALAAAGTKPDREDMHV